MRQFFYFSKMNAQQQLLDQFIEAARQIDSVIVAHAAGWQISPHVAKAIFTAKKLLPILET